MIVEAERDDGALLVTDGEAAAILLDGQVWLTTRGAALARGAWQAADGVDLPDDTPDDLEQRLAALAAELASEEPPDVAASQPDRPSGGDVPNPAPKEVAAGVSVEDIRDVWYRNGPQDTWISEIHLDPLQLIVTSDRDRSLSRVPVTIADGQVSFGTPTVVRVEYIDQPADASVTASRLVYASRAESQPDVPAAEPEPTQPQEDDMSMSEVRSRLGLPGDATEDAVYAALDDVLDKATAPTPEPVAAAALPPGVVTIEASMLDELRRGATAGVQAAERQRTEDRDRFISAAVTAGKFAPARVEHWTKAWNADPDGTKATIDGLAEGLIPVAAAGYTGSPEAETDEYEAMAAILDGPGAYGRGRS